MREPLPPRRAAAGRGTTAAFGQGRRARPCEAVRLTKAEAFEACQLLADADRCLVRAGYPAEASALVELFDLIESRLCEGEPRSRPGATSGTLRGHSGHSGDGGDDGASVGRRSPPDQDVERDSVSGL